MAYQQRPATPWLPQLLAPSDNRSGKSEPNGRRSVKRREGSVGSVADESPPSRSFGSVQLPQHLTLVEDRPSDTRTHFGSRFVLTKSNPLRSVWTVVITLLLVYTGTVFLYRLCFIDFRIQTEAEANDPQAQGPGASDAVDWAQFDNAIAILFWIDLGANFFFSYEEEEAYEVDDLRLIAKNYLTTYFWINLVACIPDAFVELLIQSYTQDAPQSLNASVRALRLQRMSRLARLTRLTRLAKLRQQRQSAWYMWLERQKNLRIVNLMMLLIWIIHLVACGWYMCAALHDDSRDTWVARRITDHDGTSTLIESTPFDQWMCAMYFVLTVFATVGFGDISAVTIGEIFYVCFAMGVGAIVHSIVISEVINVVVRADDVQAFIKKQSDLVEAFGEHTELNFDISRRLRRWVDASAKQWAAEKYDRNEMKDILTGKFLPRDLLEQLPAAFFSGQLVRNNFLWVCRNVCNMPPRLPVLVALALSKSIFSAMEVIYQANDYSCSMFLVASGTFAYVARPSRSGGIAELPSVLTRSARPSVALNRQGSALAQVLSTMFTRTKKSMEFHELTEVTLFPYVLFSRNSYFGDEGLARAAPRAHTARCESEHGELLSLSKVDMKDLGDQFPQFGARWAVLARQHERRHRTSLSKLTFGCTYRHLAACRIQTWFRERGSGTVRRNRDKNGCADALDMFTDAVASIGRRDSSQPGLPAVQRDLERLTSIVGGLAVKVEHLLSHFDKDVVL